MPMSWAGTSLRKNDMRRVLAGVLNAMFGTSAAPAATAFSPVTWNPEITSASILPLAGASGADLSTVPGWTRVGGTGTVTQDGSGALNFNSTDSTGVAYSYETGSQTRYVECFQNQTVTASVLICGAIIDANNYYGCRLTTSGLDVTVKVNGSFVAAGASAGTVSAGSSGHIRMEIVANSTVRVYINNILRGSYTLPAAFANVTKVGLVSRIAADTSVATNYSFGVGRINHGHSATINQGVWTGFASWPVYASGKVFGGTARLIGAASNYGTTQAFSVDATSGAIVSYGLAGPASGYGDEHTSAGITIRPDGRLVAFYCMHPDSSGMRFKVSVNPYDVSAWSKEYIVPGTSGSNGTTYAQPTYLSADGKMYIFYRSDPNGLAYASSSDLTTVGSATADGGALVATPTWTVVQDLIPLPAGSQKGIYARVYSDGVSRIDIAATNSVDAALTKYDVRHAYLQGGALYTSAGVTITAGTSSTFAAMTPVATSAAPDNLGNMLVLDIQRRANGHIECLFYTIVSTSEHHYYYGLWNGSAWSKTEISANKTLSDSVSGTIDRSTAPNYGGRVGGAGLDANNEGTMYVGVGNHFQDDIYAYVTADGGTNFVRTQVSPPANPNPDLARSVDTSNTNLNIYPRCPRNAPISMAVMWTRGKYDYYDGTSNYGHGEDLFSAGSNGVTLVP